MFRQTGKLVYGQEVVLEQVDFEYTNAAGSNQGLVTNYGDASAKVTTKEFIRLGELLNTRDHTWTMVFPDGSAGEIVPDQPSMPAHNFPAVIEFSFLQNSPVK